MTRNKKLTEKEEAILQVLSKREACLLKAIKTEPPATPTSRAYWQGKREGYAQAADLIRSTLLSIRIELIGASTLC